MFSPFAGSPDFFLLDVFMGDGSLRYWAERLVGYWSLGSGTRMGERQGDTTGFAGVPAPRVCVSFRWF